MIAALVLGLQAELFVMGKPQLGETLRFEVPAPMATMGFLLVDTAPGPTPIGPVVLEVGVTPNLIILPMGIAIAAPLFSEVVVPDEASLEGLHLWTQAVIVYGTPFFDPSTGADFTLGTPLPLDAVDDYTYRLQGSGGSDLTLDEIAQSAFDLCVVDFSADGLAEFTPAQIAALQGPAEPDRIRLAYMSIGEAEDYRWYWPHMSPSLLDSANPQWSDNWKVRFWEEEWKEIIVHGNEAVGPSYLDRVIDQGFDGVFLDVVDAFEFFGPVANGGNGKKENAAIEMVRFVAEIALHARITRGVSDFLVVPQNGAPIITPDFYPWSTLGPGDPPMPTMMADLQQHRWFLTTDAIATEDIFFNGPKDEDNAYNPDNYLLGLLDEWTAAGLPVLSTEYLTKQGKVDAFYDTHAPAEGFVPYATVRDLDEMTVNPGHAPD